MIDGKPVDRGLITFQSASDRGNVTGAGIIDGKFAIEQSQGVRTGDYQVTLQAQRRTGKKLHDRQMPTQADEMAIVKLKSDTQTASVTLENAQQLEFNFEETR